ncbi:hypothetical protein FRC03_007192 [Tulasnella sp. 419]|nr:hypothetical protein FRC03_007192 [Tulasnella sp. 419]
MYSIDRRPAVRDSQASIILFNRLVSETRQRSIRLFPNLRRVGQTPSDMNIALLYQDSITDLYIGQYHARGPEHLHDVVQTLPESSNLRFLRIGVNAPSLLRDNLIFVHTLERLVVDDPDICTLELLQRIQVLPRLASLSLLLTNRILTYPHQRVNLNFPLLRTLKVEGTPSDLIELMATGIRPLSNLRLDIHLQSKSNDMTLGSQLQIVLAHLDPGMLGGLETLEVYVRGAENGVIIGDNEIHNEMLYSICHCRNLHRLTLATPISTDKNSERLLTTISSLPVLEYLDICGPGSSGSSIVPLTPAFLVRLAQRCTRLRHLEIIIAKDWSTLNVPTDGFESSSRIEAIQFGPTEWDSSRGAVDVAGILRKLFPMLKSVQGDNPMWAEVDYLLQSSNADLGGD